MSAESVARRIVWALLRQFGAQISRRSTAQSNKRKHDKKQKRKKIIKISSILHIYKHRAIQTNKPLWKLTQLKLDSFSFWAAGALTGWVSLTLAPCDSSAFDFRALRNAINGTTETAEYQEIFSRAL